MRASGGVLAGLVAMGLLGCGGDAAGPTPSSNPNAFWSLTFQWPAVNLALTAPYDTAQLIAVPRTVTGATLVDSNGAPYVVQYTTGDSAIGVSATGFVTAHSVTAGALVRAQLTVGRITLKDSALIQVTSTPLPAPLATLSIHPQPDGLVSARISNDNYFTVVPFFATMATGDPATDTICTAMNGCMHPLLVHYASSDPSIATIDQYGDVTPQRAGRVIFTVSTLAYGVRKVDSLPFSVGYATLGGDVRVWMDSRQQPKILVTNLDSAQRPLPFFGAGLRIGIRNWTGQRLEIVLPATPHGAHFYTFDDDGNIVNLPQVVDTLLGCNPNVCDEANAAIRFDSAGTYLLHFRELSTGQSLTKSFTLLPDP